MSQITIACGPQQERCCPLTIMACTKTPAKLEVRDRQGRTLNSKQFEDALMEQVRNENCTRECN